MQRINNILAKAKSNQFIKDSFWAMFGNMLAKGLAFVSAIYVARLLEKDLYGEYGLLRNFVVNISILSTFGLGYTSTKFISERKEDKNNTKQVIQASINLTFIISCVIALLILIFSKEIATVYLKLPHLDVYLKGVAIWVVLNAITTTQTGILAGLGAYKKMALYSFYVGVFSFVSTLIGTYFFHFKGAILSLIITQGFNLLLFKLLISNINKPDKKGFVKDDSDSLYFKMFSFSAPIALQEMTYNITSVLVFVVILDLSNTGELGLFTAAMQWSSIVLFLPTILRNVLLKHFSENNNNIIELKKIVYRSLALIFGLTLLPLILLVFLHPFLESLYGPTFNGMLKPIIILLTATIFMSMNSVFNQAFMAFDKNWIMFFMRFIRDVGILIVGYILIKKFNFQAATGMTLSYLYINMAFFVTALIIQYSLFQREELYDKCS